MHPTPLSASCAPKAGECNNVVLISVFLSFVLTVSQMHSDPLRYHPPVSPSVPAPVPTAGPPYYPGQAVYPPSPPIIVPTPQQPPPAKREKKTVSILVVPFVFFFPPVIVLFVKKIFCFNGSFEVIMYNNQRDKHFNVCRRNNLTLRSIKQLFWSFRS